MRIDNEKISILKKIIICNDKFILQAKLAVASPNVQNFDFCKLWSQYMELKIIEKAFYLN